MERYAIATRPISELVPKLTAFEMKHPNWDRPPRVIIVGLGAAGIELAFGVRERLLKLNGVEQVDMTAISTSVLPGTSSALQTSAEKRLKERNITTRVGVRVAKTEDGEVYLDDGTKLPFDLLVWATGPEPHKEVHAACDLDLSENGYILVNKFLQSTRDTRVFAAGDCAMITSERWVPRAGVYAVREGPFLADNLIRRLRGNQNLLEYEPQKVRILTSVMQSLSLHLQGFLSLMMTGDGQAIGFWKGIVMYNTWMWRLKDRIDRAFMNRFVVPQEVAQ